jgi:4-amino-4-deoxy-L-arabinose transferase-like glycosyltransferase
MREEPVAFAPLAAIGVATVVFLAVYNLTAYPLLWFDEGAHLLLPKNLVRSGEYRGYAGPTLGVGPTVLLPIAASFHLFGIGLLQARLVMAGYLLAAVYAFHRLARRLGGRRFAAVATALLVSSQGVSLFEYGRQVLGEVPALAFLAAALAVWFGEWESGRGGRLALAGALLGLAMITKPQFALSLAPALAIAWLANLRDSPPRLFLIPGVTAGALLAAWGAFVVYGLCSTAPQEIFAMTSGLADIAAFVFSPERMREAMRGLVGPRMYLGWLTPALFYAFIAAFATGKRERKWAVVTAIVLTNLVWYAGASIGWPRYAFLGASLASLWVARVFADTLRQLGTRARSTAPAPRMLRAAFLLTLAAVVAVPMVQTVRGVVFPPFDAAPEMAAYLDAHVPRDAVIETWELEMAFLTDHRYRFPPPALQAAALRHVWFDGPPAYKLYDPLAAEPDFVLVGDYAHLANVYPPKRLGRAYESVTWIARYHLLRRVRAAAESR